MLCRKPFMVGTVPYGCGQCLPCRINRRRQWMWRQWLESLSHDANCFVTLTYADEYLPEGGNLCPADPRDFLKRLRLALFPVKVRYFLCGEYGEETRRPHYHLSLFGVDAFTIVPSSKGAKTVDTLLLECWGKGHVSVAEFNELTAQYVCGYVVKKLTDATDPRLKGLHPEFARMSNRPGLGSLAMKTIAEAVSASPAAMKLLETTGDVPRVLKMGKRSIPLGRFLLRKLREEIGFTPEYIAQIKGRAHFEKSVEMQELFKVHGDAEVLTSTQAYLKEVHQKILNVEARSRLWKKRRTL